ESKEYRSSYLLFLFKQTFRNRRAASYRNKKESLPCRKRKASKQISFLFVMKLMRIFMQACQINSYIHRLHSLKASKSAITFITLSSSFICTCSKLYPGLDIFVPLNNYNEQLVPANVVQRIQRAFSNFYFHRL